MEGLQRYMLQAVRTQPCSLPSCNCRRERQDIVSGDGDFNAVPVGITKPEGIAHLSLAVTLFQLDFNTCQIEAGGKCSEFGICIDLEGQVMQMRTLKRVASIARVGPSVTKESYTM